MRKRSSSSSTSTPAPLSVSTPTFSCNECDHTAKTERSLQTHKRQKHILPKNDTPTEVSQEDLQEPHSGTWFELHEHTCDICVSCDCDCDCDCVFAQCQEDLDYHGYMDKWNELHTECDICDDNTGCQAFKDYFDKWREMDRK